MKISHYNLRKLYKERKITKQRMISRLGGKKLKHPVLQDGQILQLRQRLLELKQDGYEIL
jgi:hypothetical protein